jgi:hypothetical protein
VLSSRGRAKICPNEKCDRVSLSFRQISRGVLSNHAEERDLFVFMCFAPVNNIIFIYKSQVETLFDDHCRFAFDHPYDGVILAYFSHVFQRFPPQLRQYAHIEQPATSGGCLLPFYQLFIMVLSTYIPMKSKFAVNYIYHICQYNFPVEWSHQHNRLVHCAQNLSVIFYIKKRGKISVIY